MRIEGLGKSRSEWNQIIDDWIFSEIDRHILKRRLLDGLCFQQVADEVNLSIEQVKKRYHKAQKELFYKFSTPIIRLGIFYCDLIIR